jgi:hypothetical protein
VTCQEKAVGVDVPTVDPLAGVRSAIEGLAASAGGADANKAAESTAAARAARGM